MSSTLYDNLKLLFENFLRYNSGSGLEYFKIKDSGGNDSQFFETFTLPIGQGSDVFFENIKNIVKNDNEYDTINGTLKTMITTNDFINTGKITNSDSYDYITNFHDKFEYNSDEFDLSAHGLKNLLELYYTNSSNKYLDNNATTGSFGNLQIYEIVKKLHKFFKYIRTEYNRNKKLDFIIIKSYIENSENGYILAGTLDANYIPDYTSEKDVLSNHYIVTKNIYEWLKDPANKVKYNNKSFNIYIETIYVFYKTVLYHLNIKIAKCIKLASKKIQTDIIEYIKNITVLDTSTQPKYNLGHLIYDLKNMENITYNTYSNSLTSGTNENNDYNIINYFNLQINYIIDTVADGVTNTGLIHDLQQISTDSDINPNYMIDILSKITDIKKKIDNIANIKENLKLTYDESTNTDAFNSFNLIFNYNGTTSLNLKSRLDNLYNLVQITLNTNYLTNINECLTNINESIDDEKRDMNSISDNINMKRDKQELEILNKNIEKNYDKIKKNDIENELIYKSKNKNKIILFIITIITILLLIGFYYFNKIEYIYIVIPIIIILYIIIILLERNMENFDESTIEGNLETYSEKLNIYISSLKYNDELGEFHNIIEKEKDKYNKIKNISNANLNKQITINNDLLHESNFYKNIYILLLHLLIIFSIVYLLNIYLPDNNELVIFIGMGLFIFSMLIFIYNTMLRSRTEFKKFDWTK
jgi:hypothetical protein